MKKVTKLGSKWNNSTNAGTFYWNLNNAASNRNRNISRQLVNAQNTPLKYRGCLYSTVFLNTVPHKAEQTALREFEGKLKTK